VFVYRGTANLGDAVQTVALSRLLPGPIAAVERGTGRIPERTLLVANGWLGNNALPPPGDRERCLFAGVFVAQEHNLEWLRCSPFPIGARDPETQLQVCGQALPTEMIGCASLTFPRYRGRRKGIYNADAWIGPATTRTAVTLTHQIRRDMSWRGQWRAAIEMLELYRKAALVHTCRLHVALPCLAFGTPVVFHTPEPERFHDPLVLRRVSLLRSLGVVDGVPAEVDVERLAGSYQNFLRRNLGAVIEEHSPRFPE
jgi:hypothetical protein